MTLLGFVKQTERKSGITVLSIGRKYYYCPVHAFIQYCNDLFFSEELSIQYCTELVRSHLWSSSRVTRGAVLSQGSLSSKRWSSNLGVWRVAVSGIRKIKSSSLVLAASLLRRQRRRRRRQLQSKRRIPARLNNPPINKANQPPNSATATVYKEGRYLTQYNTEE